MKHFLSFLFVLLFYFQGLTQVQPPQNPTSRSNAPKQQKEVVQEKAPITEYKIISVSNDTTFVDTSLTIYKDYLFNYLRRDRFELLPFSNVGQTYNTLSHDFRKDNLLPRFGARARHFNFFEVEDIKYYHVPTPLTELFFRTVFEQGQVLDAFFTVNTSRNFNFSIAYKGMRSLGKYQHILTSTGNFRATANYETPDNRYRLKTHFVSQDLMNEENGGLSPLALEQYLSEDEEFQDRSRLSVNFEDAQSTLFGKRFFLDHSYALSGRAAGGSSGITIEHTLNFSDKKYRYEQGSASILFGPSFESVNLRDEVELEHIYNEGTVTFGGGNLGTIKVIGGLTNYNYGYNSVLILEGSGLIQNRLKGSLFSAGGGYTTNFGNFDFYAEGMINISGDFEGNNFDSGVSYSLTEDVDVALSVSHNSRAPDFNFLLYHSDYMNYNWQNDFANVSTQRLSFDLTSAKFLDLRLDYTRIGNYTFFGMDEEGLVDPLQYQGQVNYLRLKGHRELVFGVFALNNTLLYQKVLDGNSVLNVPDIVSRNSLYYHDHWFGRALYLQTGFTLNYFTDYYMDAYDPVLAEFYVQNVEEFEGFPQVDFFFNGKVRQARIFFKLEHVNSLLTGNDNFSAPLYPYRDFGIRFGLIWNYFL